MTCFAKFKYLHFAYVKTSLSFIFPYTKLFSPHFIKKKQSHSTNQHHTIQKQDPIPSTRFPTAFKFTYEKKAPQLIKWNNIKRRIKRQRWWLQTTCTSMFSKNQVAKNYNHVQWLYMALAWVHGHIQSPVQFHWQLCSGWRALGNGTASFLSRPLSASLQGALWCHKPWHWCESQWKADHKSLLTPSLEPDL